MQPAPLAPPPPPPKPLQADPRPGLISEGKLAQASLQQAFQQPAGMGIGGDYPGDEEVMGQAPPQMPLPPPQRPSLSYSINGGPMKEWLPTSQPSQGTVSSPAAVQSPEDLQRSLSAADMYDLNTGRYGEIQARHAALGEAAKSDAYRAAYEEGQFPELMLKQRAGAGQAQYRRLLTNDQGQVTGFVDNLGAKHYYEESADRTSAKPYSERQATVSREITTDKLGRLGELANKHTDAVGPYAALHVRAQQSGYIPEGMVGTLDPEIAELYTLADDLQNARIYEQSGKQINEAEFQRLKRVMPRVDQNPVQFQAAYNNFLQEMQVKNYRLGSPDGGAVPSAGPVNAGPRGPAPADKPAATPSTKRPQILSIRRK